MNLRFYVKRRNETEEPRGVCFIKEVVPKRLIAWAARALYGENHVRFPMAHRVEESPDGRTAEYEWRTGTGPSTLSAEAWDKLSYPRDGSLEQFITEHYWGYSTKRRGGSLEYRVAHEPWRVATATKAEFEGDAPPIYGAEFAEVLGRRPDSAFLVDGSAVEVYSGEKIG